MRSNPEAALAGKARLPPVAEQTGPSFELRGFFVRAIQELKTSIPRLAVDSSLVGAVDGVLAAGVLTQ